MQNNQCNRITGNSRQLFSTRNAFHLAVIISVVFFFIMLITYIVARSNDLGQNYDYADSLNVKNLVMFIVNTIILFILLQFQFWVVKHIKNGKKSTVIAIFGSLLLLFILSPLFSQIQWFFLDDRVEQGVLLIVHMVKDLVILIITLLLTALMYMVDINEKKTIENQKLLLKSFQNRYDALKNQVNPHFLFNSLNTLNGLVGYDDDKAHDYISQLSSIFRYTMQDKQIMSLRNELDFANSYIYLMKIRYNESLQIELHVDEKYMDYYILPFALQILIENAVKHNVVSNKSPLLIIIETTADDTIQIKNTIRLKNGAERGGIGLSNLDERYRLMFNKEVKIIQDEKYFIVGIPLIKDREEFS
ncbi:MAG: histidine kinase, partial [Tannerella sp.]|nr:histidine kinase [Tannerella sp.]